MTHILDVGCWMPIRLLKVQNLYIYYAHLSIPTNASFGHILNAHEGSVTVNEVCANKTVIIYVLW